MTAFIADRDSLGNSCWIASPGYSLMINATNYVFSLYQFSSPLENGTWANSDNAGYFIGYSNTKLSLHPNQGGYNSIDAFLVFKYKNSLVHVYYYPSVSAFVYNYAPEGLGCTVVILAVKDGKLFSSFTPITIGENQQQINFDLKQTTTEEFKTTLELYD